MRLQLILRSKILTYRYLIEINVSLLSTIQQIRTTNGISVFLQYGFMTIVLHIAFRSNLIRFPANVDWRVMPLESTEFLQITCVCVSYGIYSVPSRANTALSERRL